eukprot:9961160-Alexandrium_andersonii.AAC.1
MSTRCTEPTVAVAGGWRHVTAALQWLARDWSRHSSVEVYAFRPQPAEVLSTRSSSSELRPLTSAKL